LPSNNASFGRSSQSAQQLAMARLRAVEHGRSTVVATTSGISALVLPDGTVVVRSGLYESAVLTAALPRRTALTVATRYGDRVEQVLAALLLVPVFVGLRRRGRPEPADRQGPFVEDRSEPVGARPASAV
ncbi:MAG: apolipoprotein N-acyltransferase, partial [Actinobacteria bacterium]|nr:apolipoprotein N-acyltransferase [Actinomycetota bacterium]